VNLGAALGGIADKIEAWKSQRADIVVELQALSKAAQAMLTSLVEGKPDRTSRSGPSKNKGGRPKGYKMSAATKAKLRAAWKKRKKTVRNVKAVASAAKVGAKAFVKGKKAADKGREGVGNG
jgi:hypothetical protein